MAQDINQGGGPRLVRPSNIAVPERLQELREAPAVPLQVRGLAAVQKLLSGPCIVTGAILSNATAAADTIHLFDGQDAGGSPAGDLTIGPNSGQVLGFGEDGMVCRTGLAVTEGTGAITGALIVKF